MKPKPDAWRRAKGYLIHNDELYHWSTLGILQQCIPIKEDKALLLDIHKEICGSRSMGEKAFWKGFYWPTAAIDTV
jgi:hypothetical protein